MYERVAGLAPDPIRPAHKHFFVRPVAEGPLASAKAELETADGQAFSGRKKLGDNLQLAATVPANTTATIVFPDGRPAETVAAGNHRFECKINSGE